MTLAERLSQTSVSMIDKYGSSVELNKVYNTGDYNPDTGSYDQATEVFYDKAVLKNIKEEDKKYFSIKDDVWSEASQIATIPFQDQYDVIDNTWTINGKTVKAVLKTNLQDTSVVVQVVF